MSFSTVKNVFSKVNYTTLLQGKISEDVFEFEIVDIQNDLLSDSGKSRIRLMGFLDGLNEYVLTKKRDHFIKINTVFGQYMFHPVDLFKFVTLLKQGGSLEKTTFDELYEQLGYKKIEIEQIEKFNPPSAYLYNLAKSNKNMNLVIVRGKIVVGMTNYDYIYQLVSSYMERFF